MARYLQPTDSSERDAPVAIDASEIGLWDGKLVVVGGRPAVVVNTGEGFSATSAVCTHLGCIVKWKKGRRQFFCPCHGGRFGLDGQVLGGPAPRPLPKLEVVEVAGQVIVRSA